MANRASPRAVSALVAGFLALAALPFQAALAQSGAPITRDALASADYARGRTVFQQRCSACHSVAEGSTHLVGPTLHGVFKRKVGTAPGFSYSAVLAKGGFDWSPSKLREWLADPQGFLPGNAMTIPEAVPEPDQVPLLSYLMVESGSADWPRPQLATTAIAAPDRPLSERFPSFWNHLMSNTTRYKLTPAAGAGPELKFDAYFNGDGSVGSSVEAIKGFWHVDRSNQFCYALYGIPSSLSQLIECFPIEAMSIPRFREELWRTEPVKGYTLIGGIVAGRPTADEGADAHPGYWDNLFKNTIRYEITPPGGEKQVIDLWFNADKSVTSNTSAQGTWVVQGEEGKEEMCYSIQGVRGVNGPLSECFKLVLMYNPRIGARWPSKFKEGQPYWAEVVAGRGK